MKYLKVLIPVSILSLVFIIDYYNKFYKPNTSFEDESIFLYVMEGDSLAFRDSISKYIKSEKTFYKAAEKLDYLKNKKTGSVNLYKIDVTGFKELKIITPADASDPAWSPLIP